MRIAPTITLSNDDEKQLETWARGRRTAVRLVQRAQILLLAARRVRKLIRATRRVDSTRIAGSEGNALGHLGRNVPLRAQGGQEGRSQRLLDPVSPPRLRGWVVVLQRPAESLADHNLTDAGRRRLGDRLVDGRRLLSVDPAGDGGQQEAEGLEGRHRGSSYRCGALP